MKQIVLGSTSPRRKEIMGFFSIPFIQASPDFDEDAIPFDGNPINFAKTLSQGKAESLAPLFPNSIVITADTVVYKDGKSYGKPINENHGFQMLSELVGQWHTVYTALTLHENGNYYSAIESTKVLFNSLSTEQILTYQKQLHCADKAGGYMAQGAGSIIIQKIEGCYYNIVGLPVNSLGSLLHIVGIDLWQHLG